MLACCSYDRKHEHFSSRFLVLFLLNLRLNIHLNELIDKHRPRMVHNIVDFPQYMVRDRKGIQKTYIFSHMISGIWPRRLVLKYHQIFHWIRIWNCLGSLIQHRGKLIVWFNEQHKNGYHEYINEHFFVLLIEEEMFFFRIINT